jgi:hypothetical protein
MATAGRMPLGAPGLRFLPDVPLRALTGVRMDVCAFFGVAPRGPARVPVVNEIWPADRPCVEPERPRRRTYPVAVESFDDYRRLFGGFEGPGLLPYAVASFFEQGGRKAYIGRIVHDYNDDSLNAGRVAAGDVAGATTSAGPLRLHARNEGAWGNGLRAALEFRAVPLAFESATTATLDFDESPVVPLGAMLRLRLADGSTVLRVLSSFVTIGRPDGPGSILRATLDTAAAALPTGVELLEGTLDVFDAAGNREIHKGLGLSSLHHRWFATVLCNESALVFPDNAWAGGEVYPDAAEAGAAFAGGENGYAEITPEDFFDPAWTLGDDEPGEGIHSLTGVGEAALLAVPDLYSPEPLAPIEDIVDPPSLAGPEFARCVTLPPADEQEIAIGDLEGLRLDPRLSADLEEITALQMQVVEFAAAMRLLIALLDVPPGLNQRQILRWRTAFNSAYAAAYHPWLDVSRRDDLRNALITIPPSAAAAGIIAHTENLFGIQQGPANVTAAEVVNVGAVVSPAAHDELHQQSINVYLRERDGVRLTAARTLSRSSDYRQLSVRRLVTMLRLSLEQQMQWAVFEPNSASLRADIRRQIETYLRRLFRAGAFQGAEEAEAFFVRCDASLHPARVLDAGQLIAEIGIAPAEPLEFILVRLTRDGDGTLAVED